MDFAFTISLNFATLFLYSPYFERHYLNKLFVLPDAKKFYDDVHKLKRMMHFQQNVHSVF